MNNVGTKLIHSSETLDEITQKYDSSLSLDIANLKSKHSIDKPEALKKAIYEAQQKDRLMSVGIVGRVKAGKSSLLNALFFEGKDILPSAATPMTAALTTLSYAEKFSVEIEFYQDEDVQNIQKAAEFYEKKLNEEIKNLTEQRKLRENEDPKEVKERIQRNAKRNLTQYESQAAAYDQYQRMRASGLLHKNLNDYSKVPADSVEQLANKLVNYVGADGRFMPFTKSVNIYLPFEQLKEIRVIDTPGFNDPVQSREARTNELLKSCDVIFIVSPAGQFLSAQDLDMMGRITKKEGVQEIFLVASQIDTQLFGSEKRDTLQGTLENISDKLAQHMVTTLRKFRKDSPEIGTTFDRLIESGQVLFSSGISYALLNKQIQLEQCSDGEKTVWSNLERYFPDYFSQQDTQLSLNSLELLANIEVLSLKLNDVRLEKERIMQLHIENLINTKQNVLHDYIKDLLKAIDEQKNEINNTNIQDLEVQIQENENIKFEVKREVNHAYDKLKIALAKNISNDMSKVIDSCYKTVNKGIASNTSEEEKTVKRDKSGMGNWLARKLWGGGQESYTVTFTQVLTSQIVSEMENFLIDIIEPLTDKAIEINTGFKEDLYKVLFAAYRKAVNDESKVKVELVRKTFEDIVNKLPSLDFDSNISIPKKFKGKGKLTGDAADDYIENAYLEMDAFKNKFKQEVEQYKRDFTRGLPEDIATKFIETYDEELKKLTEQINNRRMSIDRLERFQTELAKVRG